MSINNYVINMKVLKVKKKFRNGENIHYTIITENIDYFTDEDFKDIAENICERDPDGCGYSYRFEYEFVEDQEIINEVLKNELSKIDNNIECLKKQKEIILNNIIE